MHALATVERLREPLAVLSAIEATDAPIVSCYLTLDRGRGGVRSALEPRARRLRARLPPSQRLDVAAAMEPIAAYVKTELRPEAHGAAIFARSAYGGAFFLALQFAAPLPDALHAGSLPDLAHLLDLRDRYDRYLVLIARRGGVRIVEVDLGSAAMLAEHDAARLRDAIACLERLFAQRRHRHLLLAGHPLVLARYRRALPAALRERVVDALVCAEHHGIDEIVAATQAVFVDWEEGESQAAASAFADAVARRDAAVAGTAASMIALRRREAKLLLVARRREPQAGWRCGACRAVRLRGIPPARCPECGGAAVFAIEATAELLRLAGQRECEVEFVDHSDPLMALGGVGCVLSH